MTTHWMTTSDGQELDLTEPRPAAITGRDLAGGLAQMNRCAGRCHRPYSVAEHSLLVCEIAERELHLDVHGQLAALLHDAHEAYTTDVPTPHKRLFGPAFENFEFRWEYLVQRLFAVRTPALTFQKAIKRADLMALATERRDLLPPTPTPWAALKGIEPIGWVDLMSRERREMDWADWRERFIDRLHELEFAREERLGVADTARGA